LKVLSLFFTIKLDLLSEGVTHMNHSCLEAIMSSHKYGINSAVTPFSVPHTHALKVTVNCCKKIEIFQYVALILGKGSSITLSLLIP
jgi:hypothetical protein